MGYRIKLVLFALGALLFLFVLNTAYEGLNTLRRLDVVEAERDRWQRPAEVLQALNLKPGDKVVDLGCGSGYFALKLSAAVNPSGIVYGVDIRRLPLVFLWIRSITKHQPNITTVLGQPDNPNIPSDSVQAVLIANTYHELSDPGVLLDRIFQALATGGRLVILDPRRTEHGERRSEDIESELHRHGFDIVSRDERFTDQPGNGMWWLIVATRPARS